MWYQKEVIIDPKKRGFHIITKQITSNIPEIDKVGIGLLNLFIKHTSASLTINENTDDNVRTDLESHFNYLVPEEQSYFRHTYEGPDDMPAHIKASLLGSSLTIPIKNGHLELGRWQGIYLCEHRNKGTARMILATLQGESKLC